jgi:Protein of unknown function (DUF4238)
MSIPKKHHFIPVFYLKQWARANGKLFEFSKPKDRVLRKLVGPRATGYQEGLNDFDNVPPTLKTYLESEFLQRSDHLASVALKKLLSGTTQKWTAEERSAWSRFVLGFRMRHPDAMSELRDGLDLVWRKSGENTEEKYQELRKPGWPETLSEYLVSRNPHAEGLIKLQLIEKAFNNPEVGSHINGMKWEVINLSKASFSLMTSDYPLESNLVPVIDRVGLIALPIGPEHLFVGVNEMSVLIDIRAQEPDDVVRKMNEFVVSRARKYVYSADASQTRFVENRFSILKDPSPLFPALKTLGKTTSTS